MSFLCTSITFDGQILHDIIAQHDMVTDSAIGSMMMKRQWWVYVLSFSIPVWPQSDLPQVWADVLFLHVPNSVTSETTQWWDVLSCNIASFCTLCD